ncbi:hypothetical protein ACP4OV_003180 [Aristida adscensionis]
MVLFFFLLVAGVHGAAAAVDTTVGFTAVPLTEAQFPVQKPYDVPLEQRYELAGGVRRMWVYCTDKPHSRTSRTKPRTEIGIKQSYTSGVWQFEGYGYVPAGTTGVSIMQVFGAPRASGHVTTLMLHVYGGRLMYYHNETLVVDDNIYDRWFKLNMIHDADAAKLTVFIDSNTRLSVSGRGKGAVHTFKFGVYTQTNSSHRMESWWRGITVLAKSC